MEVPEEWIREFNDLIKEAGIDSESYGLLRDNDPMEDLCKIVKLFIFCKKYESVLPNLCSSIKNHLQTNIAGMYSYTEKWLNLISTCFYQIRESDIFYIPQEKYPKLVALDIQYHSKLMRMDMGQKKNFLHRIFHKETFEEKLINWILENLRLSTK